MYVALVILGYVYEITPSFPCSNICCKFYNVSVGCVLLFGLLGETGKMHTIFFIYLTVQAL